MIVIRALMTPILISMPYFDMQFMLNSGIVIAT